MRLYAISDQLDGGMTWRFEATRAAARAYVAERMADYPERADDESAHPEISDFHAQPTRAGIAAALNSFVEWTCLNEH